MSMSQEIIAGLPQAVLVFPTDQKPVDISKGNRETAKKVERNMTFVDSHSSDDLVQISVLPELKALDPEMVSEIVRKQRKVRRRMQ